MQINRLFETVYLLLERKSLTARELAQRFEVSERTIYRDVDALSAAGIPIYTLKGKGGGIRLLEDFVLNKSVLSEREQHEILLGLQSLSAARYPQAEEALKKLGALFQREDYRWIEADFSRWGSHGEEQERFELLRRGILERRRLEFDYYGADGRKTRRRVEPLRLSFKGRAWYLQGYCLLRADCRVFKISRMDSLCLTDEVFTLHGPGLPPLDMPAGAPGAGKGLDFQLRLSPECAYRVVDEFDKGMVTREEDGHFLVRARFPEDEWLYGYILSFGPWAEVLEPPALRENIRRRLEKMLERYL